MESKKQAVIQINKEQYIVSEGQTILIDKYKGEKGDKVKLDVLMIVNGKDSIIGTPLVEKANVTAEIVEHVKGNKVQTSTYKAKTGSRRTVGNREQLTKIKINKIN